MIEFDSSSIFYFIGAIITFLILKYKYHYDSDDCLFFSAFWCVTLPMLFMMYVLDKFSKDKL